MHCASLLQPPVATHLTVLSAEVYWMATEEAVVEYFSLADLILHCSSRWQNARQKETAAKD